MRCDYLKVIRRKFYFLSEIRRGFSGKSYFLKLLEVELWKSRVDVSLVRLLVVEIGYVIYKVVVL